MNKKYVCSICEKGYDDVASYINCVTTCGEKLKKEADMKRLEEINAALNGVRQAKKYYEDKLNEFKVKYPKEYDINFGLNEKCSCKCDSDLVRAVTKEEAAKEEERLKDIAISYVDNGKDKPKLSAKVNGTKVDNGTLESLFEDPDVKHLAKLLGIL